MKKFSIGQKVRILSGLMTGWEGIVMDFNPVSEFSYTVKFPDRAYKPSLAFKGKELKEVD